MIRFRKPALLAIPAIGAAVAVVVAVLPASSASTTLAPRMSAVELANGLLFNQGKAASYLTILGRPAVHVTPKVLAVERFVDHALRARPALASAFARDIQSGNRVKVDLALTSLSGLTKIALDREYGAATIRRDVARVDRALSSPGQMAPDDNSGNDNATVNVNVNVNLNININALAAVVAVVAFIVAVVVLIAFWGARETPGSPGTLATERTVNLVAISLHAGR